nr:Sir2 family NAD-dependent protein deacetylase [Alishewanella maricola]
MIVVFTGAGISAASGLPTFRDSEGLWQQYDVYQLASPEGFAANPELVHRFYQSRRLAAAKAQPNTAHLAIAQLEQQYQVVVITQNIDDLHERAGSSQVIHLHGKLNELRKVNQPDAVFDIGDAEFTEHSLAPDGSAWQLSEWRPNIVWFGEMVPHLLEASDFLSAAQKVLVVGSSLLVEPAASLLHSCGEDADKYLVDLAAHLATPYGFKVLQGEAVTKVVELVRRWLNDANLDASVS